jgi:hypothetical protein
MACAGRDTAGVLDDDETVFVRFLRAGGDGREDDLLRRLAADLKDLDLGDVGFRHASTDPAEPPKAGATLLEWATVTMLAGRGLRELIRLAIDWSNAARRPVEVRIGKDRLVLGDATEEQQDRVIEAFFERHSAD